MYLIIGKYNVFIPRATIEGSLENMGHIKARVEISNLHIYEHCTLQHLASVTFTGIPSYLLNYILYAYV